MQETISLETVSILLAMKHFCVHWEILDTLLAVNKLNSFLNKFYKVFVLKVTLKFAFQPPLKSSLLHPATFVCLWPLRECFISKSQDFCQYQIPQLACFFPFSA